MGEIQRAGSKLETCEASTERQDAASNLGDGAMPVAPDTSASRNVSRESPKADTTPTPVMLTGSATGRTLPFRIMQLQRTAPLIALASIALVASSIGASADAGRCFDALYSRGQKQNGDLRTLTAAFVETTTSSLLTRPLDARGTVSVERPGRVALQYTAPDARTVIIDADRLTVAWPSRGVLQTKDIGASQRRVQKYFVNSSPDELRSHFEVIAREGEGGYVVTMTPKRKQIQEGLAGLELTIDRTSLLMTAMKMTFPNGDTKTMAFTDVKPNAPLDPARVPGSVRRVAVASCSGLVVVGATGTSA